MRGINWALLFGFSALVSSLPTFGSVTLLKEGSFKLTTGGFVEMDAIFDSTRSFNEVIGSSPVASPYSINGVTGRTTFSIRNSRLYFKAEHHAATGLNTQGYLEFDLMGYDPTPGSSNTEASFLNNPTFRVRHAFLKLDQDSWSAMAGQYWQLFTWQPYYFMTTVDVMPMPAFVYGRTPQFRLSETTSLGGQTNLDTAVAINRPPQRDDGSPDFQVGIRLSYDDWKASATGGSAGNLVPQSLSIAVSGLFREFAVPNYVGNLSDLTHYPGSAIAVNTFVPILPSTEEDQSLSLALIGGFTTGVGYGDQFSGWTGNTASPLSAAANGSVTKTLENLRSFNLDGGIGDYDSNGNFHLIQLTSYNLHLQYILPLAQPTWIDAGYTQIKSNNAYLLANNSGLGSSGAAIYSKEQSSYINLFRDFTEHVRLGFEFAHVQTNYLDNTIAHDNRYQFSSWFLF